MATALLWVYLIGLVPFTLMAIAVYRWRLVIDAEKPAFFIRASLVVLGWPVTLPFAVISAMASRDSW